MKNATPGKPELEKSEILKLCICGGCTVKVRMMLKNLYFCTEGSEIVRNA